MFGICKTKCGPKKRASRCSRCPPAHLSHSSTRVCRGRRRTFKSIPRRSDGIPRSASVAGYYIQIFNFTGASVPHQIGQSHPFIYLCLRPFSSVPCLCPPTSPSSSPSTTLLFSTRGTMSWTMPGCHHIKRRPTGREGESRMKSETENYSVKEEKSSS